MRRARAGGVGVAGELLVVRGACPLLPFRSAPAYVQCPVPGVAVRPRVRPLGAQVAETLCTGEPLS